MSTQEIVQLNEELLGQSFDNELLGSDELIECQKIATTYSLIENSISVLSDLKENKSYIYYGGVATKLGIANKGDVKIIDSIWEEELFNRIHPDDLLKKHLLELQFFYYLKSIPVNKRGNYYIASEMRILDNSEKYVIIHHRMFYLCTALGNLRLALCLYNNSYKKNVSDNHNGFIMDSSTGDIIDIEKKQYSNILSVREKEILNLVDKGKPSKEIAETLSISKNTVDRHRQNILEKLRVKNSHEACRVAKLMNLL